jgi:hypothetical protein
MMSTNNKRRRRAPGGGRKPKGRFVGNTERFNMRCTPGLKDRLEMAAKKNGLSLPQEIQDRLESTFDDEADKARDPAIWALLWMVEYAVLHFRGDKNRPAWRTNPAEFEGLKAAINGILERLRPAGDAAKLLSKMADGPGSPLARAKHVEWLIFETVGPPKPLIDHYRKGRTGKLPDFPLGDSTQRAHNEFMEREESRSQALRDLGLK